MDDFVLPVCTGLVSSESSQSCSSCYESVEEEEEPKPLPEPPINFLGWEYLYNAIENDLVKKADIIMAVVHWTLILEDYTLLGVRPRNWCKVGYDSEWNFGDFSEKLTLGWNDGNTYLFHYGYCGHLYDLYGDVVGVGVISVRFVSRRDQQQSYMCVDIEDTVATIYAPRGHIETLIPSFVSFMDRIATELVYPVSFRENKRNKISQTVDYATTKYYRSMRDEKLFECDDVLAAQTEHLPYDPRERLTYLPREMLNRSSGLPKIDDVPDDPAQMKFRNDF